jgi:hypothetical protein
MKSVKTAILILLFALSLSRGYAQLAISPPYVSVDSKSGVGNIFISNNSAIPQEVEISFAFGYPSSDTLGNMVVNYSDSAAYKQYAMDPIVRAFPRTFILPANQQRTIRVQVKPSPGMKDGFYFTRVKVLAKPQTPDVSKPAADGSVTTNIKFNFEQVIPAFYKRGNLTTGIKIDKIDATQKDTVLSVKAGLERMGAAPFIGTMTAKLIDSKGKVIAISQSPTTAYFKVFRRLDLSISKIVPGPYKMELSFETKRSDMSASDLTQAPAVVESIDVKIK